MIHDVMKYETNIWETADLLIGAGIKQSDFPKFMMPFFALVMVESRFLRMSDELKVDLGIDQDNITSDEFIEYVKEQEKGYNTYLFEHNKTLRDICQNDKSFEIDYDAYLSGFDGETKDLLGIEKSNEEEKFLDISGISGQLKKKKILFSFVKAWSEINLKPFNNSEITTLEEHIKRKWADISADTAGEQYTPDDVISLISAIVSSKVEKTDRFLTIYDPTCGGGNMLFGVEDRIKETLNRPTATYGQDWSDSLYALAKIESRFRENSHIKYGNTLTSTEFYDKQFDVVVANPPYGVDWKGYKKDIEDDKTGRFVALPSVSDGQLLFLQHIISKMDDLNGIAVIVHNGSTLFNGDAGSGESNIRKWIFEKDYVESIIQLPTDEFFNTNIYTYLWVLNKNKPKDREKKVIMINASDKFKLLTKNKGKKRKEIDNLSRENIVRILNYYQDTEIAKVYDREYFFFNKQAIMLTNLDVNGKSFEQNLPKNRKTLKLTKLVKINQLEGLNELSFDEFEITKFDKNRYKTLKDYNDYYIKPLISRFNYKEKDLKVYTKKAIYYYDVGKNTIMKQCNGQDEELGCGKIIIKSSYKKETKTKDARIEVTIELTPDYSKDYEIIPYSENIEQNNRNIEAFMAKYITKPFKYLDNTIGVEVNFNRLFYKLEKLRDIPEILSDINSIEKEINSLEKGLAL